MEFDKSRVYTALNADKLKAGDKVYVANKLSGLQYDVENECNLAVVEEIYDCNFTKRFKVKFCYNEDISEYYLAYLVEKAEEKKWRPFKNIDELEGAWIRKTSIPTVANTMPLIWVKYNNTPYETAQIMAFDNKNNAICVIDTWYDLTELFDKFTFLDGSPCGKEIEE